MPICFPASLSSWSASADRAPHGKVANAASHRLACFTLPRADPRCSATGLHLTGNFPCPFPLLPPPPLQPPAAAAMSMELTAEVERAKRNVRIQRLHAAVGFVLLAVVSFFICVNFKWLLVDGMAASRAQWHKIMVEKLLPVFSRLFSCSAHPAAEAARFAQAAAIKHANFLPHKTFMLSFVIFCCATVFFWVNMVLAYGTALIQLQCLQRSK